MRSTSPLPLLAFSSILLVGLSITHTAEAKEECTRIYAACMEEAYKLPGSIYDTESPFYKAWRACSSGEAHTCEFGPSSAPSSAPAVRSSSSVTSEQQFLQETVPEEKYFYHAIKYPTIGIPDNAPEGTAHAFGKGNPDNVKIQIGGDLEVPIPLKKGMQVHQGDIITTGPNNFLIIKFKNGEIAMAPDSSITVSEYAYQKLNDTGRKTSLYLSVGYLRVLKHKDAPRGDFSVVTPTCISAVRGSAMVVSYDKAKNITTVYVTEDKADVTPKTKGAKKVLVKQGYKVVVGADGKVSAPQQFTNKDLPALQRKKSATVKQTRGKPSKVSLPGTPASRASSSSVLTRLSVVGTQVSAEAAGYPRKNATDNSPTSMWVSSTQILTANNDVWISLDFGAPKHVQRLKWRASKWEPPYPSNGPSKFRIQRSDDGQQWTDVGGVVDLGTDAKNPRQFDGEETFDVKSRYLRLKVERVNDGTGWSLGLKDFWAEGKE